MKSKKSIYILIISVAIVWSLIFYRVYAGMKDDTLEISTSSNNVKEEYFKLVDHSGDKVELDIDYSDPFARDLTNNVKASEEPFVVKTSAAVKPMIQYNQKPQVNWATITYTGHISNPSTKKSIGIFLINGRESMLREGETADGLKFIKFCGDSAKIKYQNTVRFILIK